LLAPDDGEGVNESIAAAKTLQANMRRNIMQVS
jgi:hypothetical protein